MGWDGRQQKAVVEVQTRAQEAAALVPKRVPLPAWASRLWHIFRLIGLAVDRVAASGMAGWPGCGAVQRRGSLSPHLAAAPRLTIPRRGRRARSRRRRAFMAHGASDVFLYFPSALSPFPPHATPTDCRLQGPAARGLGGFVRSVVLPPGGGTWRRAAASPVHARLIHNLSSSPPKKPLHQSRPPIAPPQSTTIILLPRPCLRRCCSTSHPLTHLGFPTASLPCGRPLDRRVRFPSRSLPLSPVQQEQQQITEKPILDAIELADPCDGPRL